MTKRFSRILALFFFGALTMLSPHSLSAIPPRSLAPQQALRAAVAHAAILSPEEARTRTLWRQASMIASERHSRRVGLFKTIAIAAAAAIVTGLVVHHEMTKSKPVFNGAGTRTVSRP